MRRLPIPPLTVLFLFVLLAFPAAGAERTVEGTWLMTQDLAMGVNESVVLSVEVPLAVELLHLDSDTEVREFSSFFTTENCGKEIPAGGGLTMKVPFKASTGLGHWTFSADRARVASYHMLYDCGGIAIGVAWAVREGPVVYEAIPSAGGEPEQQDPALPGSEPGEPPAPRAIIGWEGTTTIQFFTLTGEPLPLPIFYQPFPGESIHVTELSGPFRALRAFGEPAR